LLKNRILIVDDEPDDAQTLKMGLEDNGFAVDVYNDPIDAISNFEVGSYDLLLIDIKMPKMNGFELYNKLHQIDEKAKICFITAFELYYDEFKRVFPAEILQAQQIIHINIMMLMRNSEKVVNSIS
jgi:two-component system, OmpR family, response regulator ChvI